MMKSRATKGGKSVVGQPAASIEGEGRDPRHGAARVLGARRLIDCKNIVAIEAPIAIRVINAVQMAGVVDGYVMPVRRNFIDSERVVILAAGRS